MAINFLVSLLKKNWNNAAWPISSAAVASAREEKAHNQIQADLPITELSQRWACPLHAKIGGQLHSSLHLSCSTVHPLNLCGICTSRIRSQFSEPRSPQTWEQSLSSPRNPEMSRAWKSRLSYVFTRVGLAHGGCGKNSAVSVVAGEEIAHQEHHGQAFHDLRMRC